MPTVVGNDTTAAAPAPGYHPAGGKPGPILVATTGDHGVPALEAASRLATHLGAPLRVVTVAELPTPGVLGLGPMPPLVLDVDTYVAAQRERVARQLRDTIGDVGWPVDVRVGNPPAAIAAAAREQHASLVVTGIGRHDVAARIFGGEVALRTIRRATVPVLAVTDEPLRVPPRVAVVATDFSPSSVLAARAALRLLGAGGTLHLVHVWERDPIAHPAIVARDDAYDRSLPGRFAKVEAALLDQARDVSILPASLNGAPAEQLVEFARLRGADFIAAGRQGHGLFERLLVGRVTTSLIRSAHCAVLVTPEPAAGERTALELALTGETASARQDEWSAMLDGFSRRNAGRPTMLEVDDPVVGAQAQETGYSLLGATYDRRDGRVELMLGRAGDPPSHAPHLTRTIPGVTDVAIHAGADGLEHALRIGHGDGQTLLTFLSAPG